MHGRVTDKDAAWADRQVREWRARDYQAPILLRASLIEAARKRDWSRLPEMLSYVASKDRDEIVATSLIRMVPASGDPRVVPVLLDAVREVNTPEGTVILVDMFGGTPSNLSLSLLSRGKIEIITGVNLPMIIEAASSSLSVGLNQLISMLTASGQRGIRSAGTILEQNVIAGK